MTRQQRPRPTRFHIDSPIIWLAYLPLFFIPWFIGTPTTLEIVGGLAGLIAFLGIYFAALPTSGTRRLTYAIATLVLSFALAFSQGNWTVIAIYAASMVGELRPGRRAGILLGLFALATLAVGVALQQHPFYWAFGIFLMVMVGAANISRATLEEKNRALAQAQDEVKQMAATAERERIGRDLHDLLGRTLTLIAIKADLAVKLSSRDLGRAETEMREVAAAARDALTEVRAPEWRMTLVTASRRAIASTAPAPCSTPSASPSTVHAMPAALSAV